MEKRWLPKISVLLPSKTRDAFCEGDTGRYAGRLRGHCRWPVPTGKAQIQHARLKAISEATGVPLVLHGGTGVSDEDMRLAVTEGINKVNVGTEMNVQWVDRCKSTFEKGKVNDSVRKFLIPANQAVTAVLMEKMALFK